MARLVGEVERGKASYRQCERPIEGGAVGRLLSKS